MDRELVLFLADLAIRAIIGLAVYFAFRLASKFNAKWVVTMLVYAAEQVIKGAGLGEQKRAWVLEKAASMLNLTQDELLILLESAVGEMNQKYKKYFTDTK